MRCLILALKTGTLKHTFDLTGVQYGIGNKLSDVSSQRKEAYVLRKDDAAWMQDKLAEILPDAQVQELDAGQISPRAEIVLHMELEGNYAEKTAGRIDQILRPAIFMKRYVICVLVGGKRYLSEPGTAKKCRGKVLGTVLLR